MAHQFGAPCSNVYWVLSTVLDDPFVCLLTLDTKWCKMSVS